MRRLTIALAITALSITVSLPALAVQSQRGAASRLIGEVSANGQHMCWLQMLSDEIGSRLTGSPGCREQGRRAVARSRDLAIETRA
jgi:hypothetical protein